MISGIDLTKTVDYVLKNDTDDPTTWRLAILPSSLFAKFTEKFATGNHVDYMYMLVQVSLRGWEKFNIEFKTEEQDVLGEKRQVIPRSILDQISFDAVTELAVKCIEMNKMTAGERKN